jgi:uncharacterized protein (DUF1697 family)
MIAFLRAINVGGHTVKMETLRQQFETLGFSAVETFIASGNVIFSTRAKPARALEEKIERHLQTALGYPVATFVRTEAELAEIAQAAPFSPGVLAGAVALNVAFLREPPDAAARQRLMAQRTAIDEFAVLGREVYWLCRQKQSDSTFSNAVLEKALGGPSTLRGLSTLQKMAARYAAPKAVLPAAGSRSAS